MLSNSDLRKAVAEVRTVLSHTDGVLAVAGELPPLIAARTVLGLEAIRTDLHKLASAIEDATASTVDATDKTKRSTSGRFSGS